MQTKVPRIGTLKTVGLYLHFKLSIKVELLGHFYVYTLLHIQPKVLGMYIRPFKFVRKSPS